VLQKEIMRLIPENIKNRKTEPARSRTVRTSGRRDKTIILLVNGYNGLGLFSLFRILDSFGSDFRKIVFLQVGLFDSKSFKASDQYEKLKEGITMDLSKYKYLAEKLNFPAEFMYSIGTDVVEEVERMLPEIMARYPNAIFIGGQLIFDGNAGLSRLLHNYTIFAIQRKLYQHGLTTIVMPISMDTNSLKALKRHV
jgi:hypothetical protein